MNIDKNLFSFMFKLCLFNVKHPVNCSETERYLNSCNSPFMLPLVIKNYFWFEETCMLCVKEIKY